MIMDMVGILFDFWRIFLVYLPAFRDTCRIIALTLHNLSWIKLDCYV